ncbi:MAG: AAA family ATPase [Eubacteriales bacterium]|nr:AAA family ATPase [Eubacteriales bacterium]
MQILELKINCFAGIKDFSWQPDSGFNFLYGGNESGKSTILAFIRAMFYGLGRQNANPAKNARLRYLPWQSDAPASGSLRFSLRDQNYLLERSFGREKAADICRLWHYEGSVEVPLKNPDIPGEELLGLTEEEFLLICLVEEGDKQNPGRSLQEKIARLLAAGSEDVSPTELKNQLKKSSQQLTNTSSTGSLDRWQLKVADLEKQLEQAYARDQAKQEKLAQQETLGRSLQEVEEALTYHDLLERRSNLENDLVAFQRYQAQLAGIASLKAAEVPESYGKIQLLGARDLGSLSVCAQKIHRLEHDLKTAKAELTNLNGRKGELSLVLHQARAEQDHHSRAEAYYQQQAEARRGFSLSNQGLHSGYGLAQVGIIATAILISLLLIQAKLTWPLILVWLIAGSLSFVFYRERQNRMLRRDKQLEQVRRLGDLLAQASEDKNKTAWRIEQTEQDLAMLEQNRQVLLQQIEQIQRKLSRQKQDLMLRLKPYIECYPQGEDPLEVLDFLRNYSLESEKRRQWLSRSLPNYSQQEVQALEQAARKAKQELPKIQQQIRKWESGRAVSELNKGRAAWQSDLLRLREELAVHKAALQNLNSDQRNTANLERELATTQRAREQAEQALLAHELAIAVLEIASRQYQASAGPELHQRANNWLSLLSKGRYNKLQISPDLNLSMADANDQAFHHDSFYSHGTRVIIRLALRLALGDRLAAKEHYQLPLLLDESLAVVDHERLETALAALCDYAATAGRQIIYLSSSLEAKAIAEREAWPLRELEKARS